MSQPFKECKLSTTPHPTDSPPEKAKTEKFGINADQIPFEAIEEIGKIFAEGEIKYGRDNWKKGLNDIPFQRERLNHAILHLMKYANEDTTEEHLAKVAWFCVTQIYYNKRQQTNES